MELGMMVPGVIRNHDRASPAPGTGPSQVFEERMETHCVEPLLFAAIDQLPVAQTDGPEITSAPPGWMVQQDGVRLFGWNPHPATRSVLLKVDLIRGPQIHVGIGQEVSEFFYISPEARGPLGRSMGAVYAYGSQGS